jgi:hypothetical protein
LPDAAAVDPFCIKVWCCCRAVVVARNVMIGIMCATDPH